MERHCPFRSGYLDSSNAWAAGDASDAIVNAVAPMKLRKRIISSLEMRAVWVRLAAPPISIRQNHEASIADFPGSMRVSHGTGALSAAFTRFAVMRPCETSFE